MAKFLKIDGKLIKMSEEALEKAAKAAVGTTATWGDGKQYRKVAENKWEPVGDHSRGSGSAPHPAGGHGDVKTPSQLHEKFRVAMEEMSKEHRAIFRGGHMDFEKKTFTSPDGRFSLHYKDGKISMAHNAKLQKAGFDDIAALAYAGKEDGYDEIQLVIGIQVEMEHTDSATVAMDIAIDHLDENPNYYTELIAAGLVSEDINLALNVEDLLDGNMQKARIVKYIKRIKKPTGKGYYYFYNKADFDRYKKTGKLPEEKKSGGVFAGILAFFGLKSKDEAKQKAKDLYTEHKAELAGVDLPTFTDYLNEYLTNKAAWDKRFSAQPEKKSDEKAAKKDQKKAAPKKAHESNGKKYNLAVMKKIAGWVGGKKKESTVPMVDYNKMFSPETIKHLERSVKAAKEDGNKETAIESDQIISSFSDKLSAEEYKNFDWKKAESILFAKLKEIEKKYSAQVEGRVHRQEDAKGSVAKIDNKKESTTDAKSGSGSISVQQLMELENKAPDRAKEKEYADYIFSELDKRGVTTLSQKVYDKLEDRNYHTLNSVLMLGGYFGKDKQEAEIKYVKERMEKKQYVSVTLDAVSSKVKTEAKSNTKSIDSYTVSDALSLLGAKSDHFVLQGAKEYQKTSQGKIVSSKNLRDIGIWTDSKMLVFDKKISDKLNAEIEKKYPEMKDTSGVSSKEDAQQVIDRVKPLASLLSSTPAKMTGVHDQPENATVKRKIYFSCPDYENVCFDADRIAFFHKQFGNDITLHLSGKLNAAIVRKDGKDVGMLMPVHYTGEPQFDNMDDIEKSNQKRGEEKKQKKEQQAQNKAEKNAKLSAYAKMDADLDVVDKDIEKMKSAQKYLHALSDGRQRKIDDARAKGVSESEILNYMNAQKKKGVAYLQNLKNTIFNKDQTRLTELLHIGNKMSRAFFEELTGVKLGSTNKSMEQAIYHYVHEMQDMSKAFGEKSGHKYVKRIERPGGARNGRKYVYFYTQKQVEQFKKDGTIPPQKGSGDDKKPTKDKKALDDNSKQTIKTTLKKVANILSEALKGRDMVAPAGHAIEEGGESMSHKKKQQQKKPDEKRPEPKKPDVTAEPNVKKEKKGK